MDQLIYQKEMLKFIEKFPDDGSVMIPVHGKTGDFGTDAFFRCGLFPEKRVAAEMENINATYGSGTCPGFNENGTDSCFIYKRFNNAYGMEPFVIERNFDGLGKADEIEITEEFRLLNNLYFDREKNQYIDLETDTTVVSVEGDFVKLHRKYLKRFLAVKKMVMLIHIDSRYTLSVCDPSIVTRRELKKNKDKIYEFLIDVCNKQQTFSKIYAKFAIRGCEIADCGYWPYNENNRYYEKFIIGIDKNGNSIEFTCNPQELSNRFEKIPDAPHYLTPIFFRREVLQKYYNNPERYSIESGIIRCGNLRSLYVDNETTDYISAYLGDLGCGSLDENEQKHWKNYNIAIDGKLSKTKMMRDFHAIPTQSNSPIFVFQSKYKKINKLFEEKVGWPLFLPLHDDDKFILRVIRIPLSNSQPEFEQQILYLVKLIIDSLNECKIDLKIPSSEGKGSIKKLEKFFEVQGLKDYVTIIKDLRNIQSLRSACVAHMKGKKYEKIAKVFGIGSSSYIDIFFNIMEQANAFLDYIELNIDEISV